MISTTQPCVGVLQSNSGALQAAIEQSNVHFIYATELMDNTLS